MTLTYMFLGTLAAVSLALASVLTWLVLVHPAELFVMVEGLIS